MKLCWRNILTLLYWGLTFDAKVSFEKHLRSVSSAAAQRLGILRKSWQLFHDRSFLLRSFWSFVLPVLEYFSAVWCLAADSHIKLLDRVVRSVCFLSGGVIECNLAHRRSVAELCMLLKIKSNPMHGPSWILLFMPALLLFILSPVFLPSSFASLSYFIPAVPMRECLEKHSYISSPFPIAILNGICLFQTVQLQVHNMSSERKTRNCCALVNLCPKLNSPLLE